MGGIFSISVSSDALCSPCLDFTAKNAAYISNLENNLQALQNALIRLLEARNDVTRRVNLAEQQHMTRLDRVQGWLSRVQATEDEVRKLVGDDSRETQKLNLGGYYSKYCKSSYKFGKKVVKQLQVVNALISEGAFDGVADRVPQAAVDERPLEPTVVGLQSTFDTVWRHLGEDAVGIIGLYGMGGVGKTTLLTQINNKFVDARNDFDFDVVIWVLVSKEHQLEKVQETIGKKIGLSSENKSVEEKAEDIHRILSKKKFVLLLDDIWERIDLRKVGVPQKSPSKIIFTTRSENVCGSMEAHKKFKVKCLRDEEAWNLFQSKVGEDALKAHPSIPNLAKTVAKECDGLPLALITIGRAMACKKTPEEWSYAADVLRRASFQFPGMEKEVYPLLKFSYDSLADDTIRSCLLYCSLFPEDYKIPKEDMIDCWISEGFLSEDDRIIAQNQGHYVLGVLLDVCLLEKVGTSKVRMHDVIRDMALWIAREIEKEKENYLVHAGGGLIEAPMISKWEGVRRISLMENKIENLLETPKCPHLLTLFLNSNRLSRITSGFFQLMPHLVVLNLSDNDSLTELPLGISKLVSLQHLDLSSTSIAELPKELKALVNLKYFNLEWTRSLHRIPRQLLSNFSKLHVLRMRGCGYVPYKISEEDNVLVSGGEFLLEELLCLKHLNILSINLKIDYGGDIQKARTHLNRFQSLNSVFISACSKLRELTWLVSAPNLKIIYINNCPNLEKIISIEKLDEVSEEVIENLIFPCEKLRVLCLMGLPNLKSIYWKALAFPHLEEMTVDDCPKLNKLPLDSNSAKECKMIIKGQKSWWNKLQWEDQATQDAFAHCYRVLPF